MLILPIHTDRRLRRIPWMNGAVITVNVLIWLQTYKMVAVTNNLMNLGFGYEVLSKELWLVKYYLWPDHPELWQFLTYQFLHSDWMHLVGNMMFLFVFGNAIEDRFGRASYLFFYLSGGVIAGIAHALVEPAPVLGASGAVAAITGAYLALFPLSNVTLMVWFLVPLTSFEISSMLLILFRVGQDVFFHMMEIANTAYLAHLVGYGFGFSLGMGLLLTRLLSREPYDLLALIKHRQRRLQFQRLARDGDQPWNRRSETEPRSAPLAIAQVTDQGVIELRAQIIRLIGEHDLSQGALLYRRLIKLDPNQVMNQQHQLDLANQLMAESEYHAAARAYELFLRTFGNYAEKQQIQLILGLIYARYLDQHPRAIELLCAAKPRLEGEEKILAQQVLQEIK